MKYLISFLAGAAIAAGVLWLIQPEEPATINWHKLSDNGIVNQMEKASLQDVQRYVNYIDAEELPPDYIIKAYVANAKGVRKAEASVNQRYPRFKNKSADDWLSAVRENPLLYRNYQRELKSIRKRFVKNPV